MELILLVLALPIILILLYKTQRSSSSKSLQLPGPQGLPLIGNLHQFDGEYPHTYLYRLSQKYGPMMSLKLGSKPVLVISSAKVIKEIMKSHDLAFSGRPTLSGLKKLSYGLLDIVSLSYCESWRERRKLCTLHLFSLKQLQSFRPIRESEVSLMINKIAKDASLGKASDLSDLTLTLTSNIICRMALGKTYGQDSENNRFAQLFKDTQAMMGGFFVADYFPALKWIDKISGMNERLEKNFLELDAFYKEVIDEHLGPNKTKTMEGDVIDILLGMSKQDLPNMELTIDHIKAILMNILTGGTDTSAAVSVWAMAALMKNPVLMKKVQTEIRESAGKKDFIDEDDIAKLPYFKAVIKETFRLYPPGPLLAPRETMDKCNILGYDIQPGTMVYINAWAIGRDPENWNNPEEFIPERFLEKDIDIKGRDPEVIPFGIGRRGCPAMTTGLAMVELAVANLLYTFDWECPDGMKKEDIDFDALPGLTMHKKDPLCLVAKPVVHG